MKAVVRLDALTQRRGTTSSRAQIETGDGVWVRLGALTHCTSPTSQEREPPRTALRYSCHPCLPPAPAPAWPTRLTAGQDGRRGSTTNRVPRPPGIGPHKSTPGFSLVTHSLQRAAVPTATEPTPARPHRPSSAPAWPMSPGGRMGWAACCRGSKRSSCSASYGSLDKAFERVCTPQSEAP